MRLVKDRIATPRGSSESPVVYIVRDDEGNFATTFQTEEEADRFIRENGDELEDSQPAQNREKGSG